MPSLFNPSERYEPKETLTELMTSPFGLFAQNFGLVFTIRAKDEVAEVYDRNGKAIEVEPYQYLYVRDDGSLYADWE